MCQVHQMLIGKIVVASKNTRNNNWLSVNVTKIVVAIRFIIGNARYVVTWYVSETAHLTATHFLKITDVSMKKLFWKY